MEVYDSILDLIGNTPLLRLHRFAPHGAPLLAKLETFNPGSSVKDRIGPALIEAGRAEGKLKDGGTIVEPTSGNTGIGLAMAARLMGYKLICTAPDKIPAEKVALLEALGAKVVLCGTHLEANDPGSYYKVAERYRDEEGAYLPYQYYNQANPMAHYHTTGPEIWRQTDGTITHWVAGIGTGGTISGVGRFLKEQNPDIKVIGIDTVGSIYAYLKKHGEMPPAEQIHQYLIDGIGEDFLPDSVWFDEIDEVITVSDRDAYRAVFELAATEAILPGSSGGAAVWGARQVAAKLGSDSLVVTLLPDSGERYLSKLNDSWLQANDLGEVRDVGIDRSSPENHD